MLRYCLAYSMLKRIMFFVETLCGLCVNSFHAFCLNEINHGGHKVGTEGTKYLSINFVDFVVERFIS